MTDQNPDAPPAASPDSIDRHWHLARTETELSVADLEYALLRCHQAFDRWQSECLATVADVAQTGPENALLHVIRMNDRPKSIHDLAHMSNRQDIPNIQYSLRKLIAAGLISRSGSGRSGVTYDVTDEGRAITDRYTEVRAAILIAAVETVPDLARRLDAASRALELMTGLYDQAARTAATHRRRPGAAVPPVR